MHVPNRPICYHVILASYENLIEDNVIENLEAFGTKLAGYLNCARVKPVNKFIDAAFAQILERCPKFRRSRSTR